MRQILDLHLHSRYSRACSPRLTLVNLDKAARIKGIDIIGTGDFTHPAWFSSLEKELEEIKPGDGLYKVKGSDGQVKFILSSEVSLIYKDKEKVRKIHLVVHAPNIEAVKKLNKYLGAHYNIKSDGRPILGIKAPEFVKLCLGIDAKFLIYPAHIWTPWFSVFGSKSGFDSLDECFKEQTKYIYAYETGLSSDPTMNWRLSALDNLTCLSNSDAHSLENIGREANIFDLKEITYVEIYRVIKERDLSALKGTIEFYPEEGMYYFDGHDACNYSCPPRISRQINRLCPVCKKPLVIGVLSRVEELADRSEGFEPKNMPSFKKLVELDKIIAAALNLKSRKAKKVQELYHKIIEKYGSELFILLDLDLTTLDKTIPAQVWEGIKRVRAGQVSLKPGFDGRYGEIKIFI